MAILWWKNARDIAFTNPPTDRILKIQHKEIKMDPEIEFTYEDKRYTVPLRAYDLNRIVLPDGRVLEANAWLESYPPQPEGLHEVQHLFTSLPPEEIAHQMNGVVAELNE